MIEFYCPECGSDEIIKHNPSEWQCKKCGKYVKDNYIKQYNELDKLGSFQEIELPKIDKLLEETNAKPIMTIYTANSPQSAKAKSTKIYEKSDHTYIGIVSIDIPHTLPLGEYSYYYDKNKKGTYRSPQVKVFTSNELPKLRYHQPESYRESAHRIPIGQTQSEVFEGIAIGGVVSGGTRTVTNTQYQWVGGSYSNSGDYYTLEWSCKDYNMNGKNANWQANSAIVFFHTEISEVRYSSTILKWEGKIKDNTEFYYLTPNAPVPELSTIGKNSFSRNFPIVWHDYLSGDIKMSNAEYYQKAKSLLNSGSYANIYRAEVMFSILGEYEDSKLQYETCKHKEKKFTHAESNREERSAGQEIGHAVTQFGNLPWGWIWLGMIVLGALVSSCTGNF